MIDPFPAADATREPVPGEQPEIKSASAWMDEIRQADKDSQKWRNRAKKIVKIYTEDRSDSQRIDKQYAMLWANTEVIRPAVYTREPKPVVSRRFSDRDPVAKSAGEVLERSLSSTFDRSNLDACMRLVRDDFVLVARGTAWVRYEPSFIEVPADAQTGLEAYEQLQDETLAYDFVPWQDFIVPKAKCWDQVPWIGRRVYMDKKAITARWGEEKANQICNAVAASGSTSDYMSRDKAAARNTYCIYEVWSKRDQTVVWVADGYENIIEETPPLYPLSGFYPCPKPAFGTMATDSVFPVPDYVYYQDQAEEINELTGRIGALTDALKLVGFYPAGAEGEISNAIERALNPNTDNMMIPVPSWAVWQQGGGVKQMIEWLPVDMVAKVLQNCIAVRKQMVEDVYQITGISDILRGSSAASETATAQQIKAQWGGVRIREKQYELMRFARDITRISAEIIAEVFKPETLWRMSGMKFPTMEEKQKFEAQQQMRAKMAQQAAQQPPQPPPQPGSPPQAAAPVPAAPQLPEPPPELVRLMKQPTQEEIVALLRDDRVRSYRVDIETDSTIEADEQAEKASRNEFIQVVGGFLGQAIPMAREAPAFVPAMGDMLMFVARAYRAGRGLEDSIESAVEEMVQQADTARKQPPPPDPKLIVEQEKLKVEQEKNKGDFALRQEQLNLDKAKLAQDRMGMEVSALTGGVMDPSMVVGAMDRLMQMTQQTQQAVQMLTAQQAAPAEIIRDGAGEPVAIRKGSITRQILRGPDGAIAGIQ